MLTVPQAARRAGRDAETVRRWIRSGRLAARKVGTQHVVEEADLDTVLAGDAVPLPTWLRRTATGERMPDVVAAVRRQRAAH